MNTEELTLSIEKALNEIRPFLNSDGGDISLVAIEDDKHVKVRLQGACTSCPSAIGSTLQAIEGILQTKVYFGLSVKPDLSFLNY